MDFISSDSCCSSLSFELLRITAAVLRLWRQEMSVGLREIFYVQLVGAFKRPEIEQKDPQSRADSCRATFVPLPRELYSTVWGSNPWFMLLLALARIARKWVLLQLRGGFHRSGSAVAIGNKWNINFHYPMAVTWSRAVPNRIRNIHQNGTMREVELMKRFNRTLDHWNEYLTGNTSSESMSSLNARKQARKQCFHWKYFYMLMMKFQTLILKIPFIYCVPIAGKRLV